MASLTIRNLQKETEERLRVRAPARILLDPDGEGEFSFGCVNGAFSARQGGDSFESRWTGNDEMDQATGSPAINLEPDGALTGEMTFDNGDESGFRALPWALAKT